MKSYRAWLWIAYLCCLSAGCRSGPVLDAHSEERVARAVRLAILRVAGNRPSDVGARALTLARAELAKQPVFKPGDVVSVLRQSQETAVLEVNPGEDLFQPQAEDLEFIWGALRDDLTFLLGREEPNPLGEMPEPEPEPENVTPMMMAVQDELGELWRDADLPLSDLSDAVIKGLRRAAAALGYVVVRISSSSSFAYKQVVAGGYLEMQPGHPVFLVPALYEFSLNSVVKRLDCTFSREVDL